MKILLLSPPYKPEYMRNARCDYVSISHTQWYPIWLSCGGALLEKYGHKVEILDAPAENLTTEQAIDRLWHTHPDLTVVYSSTKSENSDIKFAELIKEISGCKLVFVGPFVSIDPMKILEKSSKIDYAVKGEFDYPVLEIAEELDEKNIKNLLYHDNSKIVQNPSRPPLTTAELDELPFVTQFYKNHLNLNNYRVLPQLHPFVDLFTGRGCAWGQCTFCLWVHSFIPGSNYNTRSIDNVLDEISFIYTQMKNVKEIFIQDDMLPKSRIIELSNAIIDSGLDMKWSCYVKPNIDADTLDLMKRSGCRVLHVGYESAIPTILKTTKKGLTPEIMTKFTKDAQSAGLKIHGDFLFGLNGESKETIEETIKWSKELNPDTAQFSIMNPYEGTPFYEWLTKNNYTLNGEPNYPNLSNEEIRQHAQRAIKEFYLSKGHITMLLKHPRQMLSEISQLHHLWKK